jgi:hypothetical protein
MIYFQIYNHFDSDNDNDNDNDNLSKTITYENNINSCNNECIICLETSNSSTIIIKLTNAILITNNEINTFKKNCECECNIHQICLNEWVQKNNSCPICRTKFDAIIGRNIKEEYNFIYFCLMFSTCVKKTFTCVYSFLILALIYNISNYILIIVDKNT